MHGATDKSTAIPATTAPTVSLIRIDTTLRILFPCGRIARNISFVNRLTRRNGSSDIDDHRVAGPAFHELLLPKVAVKSFFHHFNTSEIHKLRIRFEPAEFELNAASEAAVVVTWQAPASQADHLRDWLRNSRRQPAHREPAAGRANRL